MYSSTSRPTSKRQGHRQHRRRARSIPPSVSRTLQRETPLIPRDHPVTRRHALCIVRIVIYAPDAASIHVRVPGKPDLVRSAATIEVALAKLVVTEADGIRPSTGQSIDGDVDCILGPVPERLVRGFAEACVAIWGAGAARVAGGAEGGGIPADLRVGGVVGSDAVEVVGAVEPGEAGHLEGRGDVGTAGGWDADG